MVAIQYEWQRKRDYLVGFESEGFITSYFSTGWTAI